MKRIALLFIGVLLVGRSIVAGADPSGSVRLNWTAISQDLSYEMVSSKTSADLEKTTTVWKSTANKARLKTADIIQMLANSFNTNLPPDALLIMTNTTFLESFVVTDNTGTNVLLDCSNVLTIFDFPKVNEGTETSLSGGGNLTGKDTEVITSYAEIGYDDMGRTTKDGTHSLFVINGIVTGKYSRDVASGNFRELQLMQGAGSGTISDKQCIVRGTMDVVLSGTWFPGATYINIFP